MEKRKTVLYEDHFAFGAGNHMADFAGYLMPLWYSSISEEHQAVRNTAGIFDCTHMGVFEVSGKNAQAFLNLISTNNVEKLTIGKAQYSFILDFDGNVLDDIIIYKISEDNFMVVVNAANGPKINAWFNTISNDERFLPLKPTINDLRSSKTGAHSRVDIALQGPASRQCLENLISDDISNLKPFNSIKTQVDDMDLIISTTGYTGAKTGFELYVHPDNASELWNLILETGKNLGVMPCGLGARDSLRIEAGLPLYGHELAGDLDISPFEAGYGWAIKLDKPDFIGKDAIVKKVSELNKQVCRIEFPGIKGVRPLRHNDGILNENGVCIGWVLSCAKIDDKQIALAYISKDEYEVSRKVGCYQLARSQSQKNKGKKDIIDIGEKIDSDIGGTMIKRFEKF